MIRVSKQLLDDSAPMTGGAPAGLVNDDGQPIRPGECPHVFRFPPEGLESAPCERPRGHTGSCVHKLIWSHEV